MDILAVARGRAIVKHEPDCEMSDMCARCSCPSGDQCECTCGKLRGFYG